MKTGQIVRVLEKDGRTTHIIGQVKRFGYDEVLVYAMNHAHWFPAARVVPLQKGVR